MNTLYIDTIIGPASAGGKTWRSFGGFLGVALLLLGLVFSTAAKATTYTWTPGGVGYDVPDASSIYVGVDEPSLSFTTLAPLGMFGVLTDITGSIVTLSGSDGASGGGAVAAPAIYGSSDVTLFTVITDAFGNVLSWEVLLNVLVAPVTALQLRSACTLLGTGCVVTGQDSDGSGFITTAEIAFITSVAAGGTGPGTWSCDDCSVSTTPAALPAPIYVVMLALLTGFWFKRGKRLSGSSVNA